jgi:hypothetical protein
MHLGWKLAFELAQRASKSVTASPGRGGGDSGTSHWYRGVLRMRSDLRLHVGYYKSTKTDAAAGTKQKHTNTDALLALAGAFKRVDVAHRVCRTGRRCVGLLALLSPTVSRSAPHAK